MRRLLAGVCVAACVVAALLWLPRAPASDEAKGIASAAPAPVFDRQRRTIKAAEVPPGDPAKADLSTTIDRLATDGHDGDWQQLARIYQMGSDEAKLRILQHASRVEDPYGMINSFLGTVGDDPKPAEQDSMIDEAATLMQDRWRDAEALDAGRELMRRAKKDKHRFVLAKALMTFAEGSTVEQRQQLHQRGVGNDLIDLHDKVTDQFIKRSIEHGIQYVGGKDLSILLSEGLAADISQLEHVQKERQAERRALQQLQAQQAGNGPGDEANEQPTTE